MRTQSYRVTLIRVTRYLMLVICGLGIIISLRAFYQHLNSRQIELATSEEFASIARKINVKKVSILELEVLADRALKESPPYLDLAEKANTRLLKELETCLNCEYRIMRLDLHKYGRLTEGGLDALSRSYSLSPYGDLEFMMWRFEVSERHWRQLDPELRKATLRQITAMSQRSKARKWMLNLNSDIDEISDRISRLTPA